MIFEAIYENLSNLVKVKNGDCTTEKEFEILSHSHSARRIDTTFKTLIKLK